MKEIFVKFLPVKDFLYQEKPDREQSKHVNQKMPQVVKYLMT